jgi:hypothetical protein
MSSYSPTIADNIRGLLSEQQRSDFDSASNLLDKAGSFAGSMVEDPLGLQNLGEIGIDLAYGNDIPNYKYEQLALDAATSLPFTKPFKAAVDAVKPFAKPALAGGTGLLGLTYEPTEADAAFLLGRKGVVNLYDKGIRSIPNNYFRARDLELQGVPADEIERLTGFGKSPLTNDKFAMYIHDQNFGPKRDFDPGYTGTFGADWDTGMLGFAYPDVKNLKFKVTDGRGASYSPEGNIVTFGDTLAYPGGIRQVANHEVGGHYVQGVEGWPGGTNPDFLQQSAEFFKNARTNTGLLKNIVRGIWDPDFGGSAYYASRNQAPKIIQNAQDLDPSGQLINDFVSGRSTKVGPNRVFSEPSYAGYLATPGELASSKLEFLGNQNPFVVDRANIPVTRGYGPKELNLGTNPTAAQIRDLIDWSKTDELYRLGSNEGKIVNDLAEEASWWKNPMFDIKTGK